MTALHGHGELAVISSLNGSRRRGDLYLVGGPAGRIHRVNLPGPATAPVWSSDHRWLSVRVARAPTSGHLYAYEPSAEFLVSADGRHVRRMTPLSRDVTDATWSPATDQLAVASFSRRGSREYRVDVLTPPSSTHRTLLRATYVSGLAWSPGGRELAIGGPVYNQHRPERLRWSGDIIVVDTETAARRAVAVVRGAVLDLAGWTPDGAAILYWPDPMGSGSIAADGLPLYAAPAGGGSPRRISDGGLVHPSWIAFAPNGSRFAVVDGGDRTVWGGHKHVDVCAATGRCVPVPQPDTKVSLWPAWAPDGTVVCARLTARRFDGPYFPRVLARWTSHSRLFEVRDATPSPLPGVPIGATAPIYGTDGTLLFFRGSAIWLKPPGGPARRAVMSVEGLHVGDFYGLARYHQLVAWTDERPGEFGGTS